jgi:uncharacterized membrane-anchored protein
VYHGLGTVEIPEQTKIPDVAVQMQTRKGVVVSYEPKAGQLATQKSAMDKSQRFFVCIFAVVR